MKTIFVSSPYRAKSKAGITRNINHARREAQKLWLAGWCVICPHLNSAYMTGDDSIFLAGGLTLLTKSDAIWVLKGWENSLGARCELELAKQLNLEIFYE